MKVKLQHTMAGPGGTHMAGSVIEVSDEQGAELLKGGYASKHVEAPKKEEKASAGEQKADAAPAAEKKADKPEAKPAGGKGK